MTTLKSISMAMLAASFSLLAATAGYAEEHGSTNIWTTNFQKAFQTEKTMHMIGMNKEGEVTRKDYDEYMEKLFKKMDKKGKGELDKDDFIAFQGGSTDIWTDDFQKAFRTVDMMHMFPMKEGMLTREAFVHHMGKIFNMLDRDCDGKLDKKEFMYALTLGDMQAHGDRDHDKCEHEKEKHEMEKHEMEKKDK